ncbi:MAG: hypothetical protein CH6_0213 [Candidatus Kapaibacterium sp.]|nr:MAG: hypothetical protein CH6_0213 [Candidatus Kapabacteria bacterium]
MNVFIMNLVNAIAKKIALISLLSAFLICNSNLLVAQDLLAHWSFDDGTARDVTGNGYDGILVNNPTVVQGVVGNALHFQGKGYYIPANGDVKQIGSHVLLPPIDLTKLSEFSITFWVYEEDYSSNYGDYYIWFGHFNRGWLGVGNHYVQDFNKFYLILQYTVNGNGFNNIFEHRFDYSLRNKWVCYAMVFKNGYLFAYADGVLLGSLKTNVGYSMEHFALLRHWWYYDGEERTSARFTGAIDEVKIFLRALSDEEISLECQSCGPMSFAYDKFSPTPSLRLINNARLLDSTIRLSSSSPNQVGALWTSHLVPVARGFETSFKFRLSDGFNQMQSEQHFPGADGIAFVIQNHSPFAIGNIGGGIGFDGIPNSLAIEFDTYSNDSSQIENFGDPNDNHIAVLCNGINPNSSKHFPPYIRGQTTQIPPIRTDGTIYYVKITYDNVNQRLSIWLDTVENYTTPRLVVEGIDISSELNLDGGEGAYIGFTSATGNAYENHDLLAWSFCTKSWKIYSDVEDNLNNNKETIFVSKNIVVNSSQYQKVKIEFFNIKGSLILYKEIDLFPGNNVIELSKFMKDINHGLFIVLIKSNEKVIFADLILL